MSHDESPARIAIEWSTHVGHPQAPQSSAVSRVKPPTASTASISEADGCGTAIGSGANEPVPVGADGYTHDVTVTLSAGVSSAKRPAEDPFELLEAADAALHEAMAAGKDQVRLAPG
jgi:GGDEF domain-containing protein